MPLTHTRVSAPLRQVVAADPTGRRPDDEADEPPGGAAAGPACVAPVRARPGRSALPDTLRGRVALGPAQLAAGGGAGRGRAGRDLLVGDPRRPTHRRGAAGRRAGRRAGLAGAPAAADPAAAPVGDRRAPAGSVTVDVEGKVRRPGIVVLDSGARVVDALKAAGGARPGVDLTGLNLARLLVDGEQILVGVPTAVGLRRRRPCRRPPRAGRWSTSTPRPRPSSRPCPTWGR